MSIGILFAAALIASPLVVGCSGDAGGSVDSASSAIGVEYEHFPTRASLDFAMNAFVREGAAEEARPPVSLPEFFGESIESANVNGMRIELLKPDPRAPSQKPLAFLYATSAEDRSKDARLFKLADSLGVRESPFPESVGVQDARTSIVRIWTDFRTLTKGAPQELTGQALRTEVARVMIWSYLAGNTDGPGVNGNNGGFAKFRDASGREFWRGVLVDEGWAFSNGDVDNMHRLFPPWVAPKEIWNGHEMVPANNGVLGVGAIEAADVPEGLANTVAQIARSAPEDIAKLAGFDAGNGDHMSQAAGIQARARQVADHYQIKWQ